MMKKKYIKETEQFLEEYEEQENNCRKGVMNHSYSYRVPSWLEKGPEWQKNCYKQQ
jgi:hypothetical protein